MDIKGKRYICHPTINKNMLGFQIDQWEKIISFVNAASDVGPKARYIYFFLGGDIAVTENGCDMIDGNVNAYIGDLQKYEIKGSYKTIIDYK